MTGSTVLVFRCGPAHGIGNDHYRAIRAFWERYFEAAGATLAAFGQPSRFAPVLLGTGLGPGPGDPV